MKFRTILFGLIACGITSFSGCKSYDPAGDLMFNRSEYAYLDLSNGFSVDDLGLIDDDGNPIRRSLPISSNVTDSITSSSRNRLMQYFTHPAGEYQITTPDTTINIIFKNRSKHSLVVFDSKNALLLEDEFVDNNNVGIRLILPKKSDLDNDYYIEAIPRYSEKTESPKIVLDPESISQSNISKFIPFNKGKISSIKFKIREKSVSDDTGSEFVLPLEDTNKLNLTIVMLKKEDTTTGSSPSFSDYEFYIFDHKTE